MYQGRQGYGAKRSAPPGGGGRSHPPGRPFSNVPHNTEVLVETNQNKLLLSVDESSKLSDYVQCKVDIQNAAYRRIKDETGESVRDEATGDIVTQWEVFQTTLDSKEKFLKTRLPWRIIKKWANDNGKDIAYDGASTAYFPSAKCAPGDGEEYRVQVKKDCEQNDPDADSIRDSWFSLTFTRTNVISSQDIQAALRGDSPDASEAIATMFTAVLKTSAILSDHSTLEAKSSVVFSPINMQQGQLERGIQQESRDRLKFILEGVRMTAKLQNGGMVVETEPVPQYVNKERHRDDTRVPLLSVSGPQGRENATIAGVRIDDVHRPIAEFQRAKIEEIIEKKTVNVVYSSKRDGREARHVVFKNKSVRKCQREDDQLGNGKMFIWNPSEYTFDCNGQATTVASYFLSQHSIQLRYPYLPLVYVDNVTKHGGGWFPVELVYQALSKSKENTEEMVTEILKYHDTYAGKRYIERVGRKLENLSLTGGQGNTFRDRLRRWNIEIDNRAVVEKAKVLSAPRIRFKVGPPARLKNGSFSLNRVQFSRPAKLASFAVVNFARENCNEYVNTVLRVSQSHGIEIPSTTMEAATQHLEDVSARYHGNDAVADALDMASKAVQKAKNFHLFDSSFFYRDRKVFFKTHCYSEQQDEYECLVLPPDKRGAPLGLLLDYRDGNRQSQWPSHRVVSRDGNEYDARLMVNIYEASAPIDPLDFRYHDGRHQACRGDGAWVDVCFEGYCYKYGANGLILREDEIQSKRFLHFANDWEVDFPSVLFFCLPDDGMALYNRIKVLSNYLGGCATQCAVMPTFRRQRNRDQYASNIATKLNAKLATTFEKAVSWTSVSSDGGSGSGDTLPWIGERPTLVVGVGMVHGRGRSAKTVFAASVCLDSGCMRLSNSCFVNRRSDTINPLEMKDIIKTSIKHYVIENNNRNPERILFYRDGLSDGNFAQADTEIGSIREAAEESLGNRDIPITFVIVQSSSLGFKMVPAGETRYNNRGRPINNVDSGTVLECGDNKSWYLVAHGGLKGTSKPVKYIAHLNENEQSGLTFRNLIECTNQMSFKYPSATKAVREVPVLKYAKRLANQVLNSLLVLETGCTWMKKDIKLVCPDNELLPEAERRPHVESRDTETGDISRTHNLVEIPFRSHLAA